MLNVITDRKLPVEATTGDTIDYFLADVVSYSDYYPYGMLMPDRNGSVGDYRYGFNGMEADDEVKNLKGTSYDFGARMYDPRVGRWLAIDPLSGKYPSMSPYIFVGDMPIIAKDPNGKEIWICYQYRDSKGKPHINQVQYKNGKLYNVDGSLWDERKSKFGTTYIKQVRNDLNQLKNDHPEVFEVVDKLESSKTNKTYISNHENMFRDYALDDRTDEHAIVPTSRKIDRKDHGGEGTWVQYDPFRWEEPFILEDGTGDTEIPSKYAPPRSMLAHELSHAHDNLIDADNPSVYNDKGEAIRATEVRAVRFENLVRESTGYPKKDKYGGVKIPKELLKE